MTIHMDTDIQAAKTGDREAFARLYDGYVRQVYGFIFTKVQHPPTAEDLTSQTFLKALEHIGSFQVKKASFATWLFTIARRTVIDHYRTTHKHEDIEDAWDLPDSTDTVRDTDTALRFAKVKMVMQELSTRDRDLIVLRLWQGLSFQEISDILGTSPDACKVAYGRAIQKIRTRIPLGAVAIILLLLSRTV